MIHLLDYLYFYFNILNSYKLYITKSKINGTGLFAGENIPKNEIIFIFKYNSDLQNFNDDFKDFIKKKPKNIILKINMNFIKRY